MNTLNDIKTNHNVKQLEKNIVPIALACDNNYAMPTAVTMTSIMEHASSLTYYEFYLLIPSDFSLNNKNKIMMISKNNNCKITFIDMGTAFDNSPNALKHTTNQSYYRLLLSDTLPELDKILYLDVDIIVLEDLSALYETDLGDNYYGGVIHPVYYFGNWKGHSHLLNIADLSSYINAGVLLINLKQIRHDNLVPRLISAVSHNFPTIDQDVINSVAYGKIKPLPFKYNVMIKCAEFLKDRKISELYDYDEFHRSFIAPAIVHFANPVKPWQNADLMFADSWRTFFERSPYNDEWSSKKDSVNSVDISVVMATRNREEFIGAAIESVLNQTYPHFEFLIVDDASTDNTPDILNYYQVKDKRIKVIANKEQKGISYSRNIAHSMALGKYIAVMDDDDLACPNRFEKEYAFLEKNQDIAVVGSDVDVFVTGEQQSSNIKFWRESWVLPLAPDMMDVMMILRNFICHSSVMLRKSFLDLNKITYNESIPYCVDYDLWVNILHHHGKIHVLNEILQRYRVHNKSITATKDSHAVQDELLDTLRIDLLTRFFDTRREAAAFFEVFKNLNDLDKLLQIEKLNSGKPLFDKKAIERCIAYCSGIPYPSFENDLIPVVFASDDNYVPYLAVLMKSIIEQASTHYHYEFIVLETKISTLYKQRIIKEFAHYPNLQIKFVNFKNIIGNVNFFLPSYYTEETYYRLFMQTVFRYYDKILYIDADTIVVNDISKLFNTDVTGYLFAVTINAGTVFHVKNNMPLRGVAWRDYLKNTLKMQNPEEYFQAGVLLANIKEIKNFDLQGKALEKLKHIKPLFVDQDILNAVCEGHVKKISLQWDFIDLFKPEWETEDRVNWLSDVDRADYLYAAENPWLVHYASQNLRAWNFPEIRYSDLWWKFARMTSFYEEILFKSISQKNQNNRMPVISREMCIDIFNYRKNKIKYWRYKLLSKITFGKRRKKYKQKREALRTHLRAVRSLLKGG